MHTVHMILSADVDLQAIAAASAGFVGADLSSLATQAAMEAADRYVWIGVPMTNLLNGSGCGMVTASRWSYFRQRETA